MAIKVNRVWLLHLIAHLEMSRIVGRNNQGMLCVIAGLRNFAGSAGQARQGLWSPEQSTFQRS
jgi:hypothetical protein